VVKEIVDLYYCTAGGKAGQRENVCGFVREEKEVARLRPEESAYLLRPLSLACH
jgi:hypothetical protein